MRRREPIFRWLTGWLLLAALGVGALGGAGLSVRAAPVIRPFAVCPDPTIARWEFTGATVPTIPPPTTGTGLLSAGTGIEGPTYPSEAPDGPAISYIRWDTVFLDLDAFLEIAVDTTNRDSIGINYKYRSTSSGPTTLELHYSTDGVSFIPFGAPTTLTTDATFYQLSFDLSSISALDNNPNAKFRIYAYGATAWNGTLRIDNLTVTGNCPYSARMILINEVAWMGTLASSDDEWIELYNPGSSPIVLTNWRLVADDGSPDIVLSGTIQPNDHFLLERAYDNVISNVGADQIYIGELEDTDEILRLRAPDGTIVDTANSDGGTWPAGTISPNGSMERMDVIPDAPLAWVTNVEATTWTNTDASGQLVHGTPGRANWGFGVTHTPIPPPTSTPPPTAPLTIVINEVAWAGTQASTSDEWIELYNPGSKDISLNGWSLRAADGSPNIDLSGTLLAKDYFLLERTDEDVTTISSDLIYTGSLSNNGEILRLYDQNGYVVDTANSNGGAWPAGDASSFSSMERTIIATDSNFVWVTYNASKDTGIKAKDASGNEIKGTPGRGNTQIGVAPTATPTNTPRAGSGSGSGSSGSSGGTVLTPLLGISEFLPRPGHDYNNDGLVDVFDEFIEIINAGKINVNLGDYRLDDEQNLGSPSYSLPDITLKPGERAVFYASETGVLLSDAGDTVRLLRGSSTVVDAYTYGVVRYPDQAWCRIPDRLGYWNKPCFPTPGNPNALAGTFPLPPGYPTSYRPPLCLLPDTTPEQFVYAECEAGGDEIWNRKYWDELDAAELLFLEEVEKWGTVFE